MTSPTYRRAHPARRARTIATVVTSGATIAMVTVMGVTRHSPANATGTVTSVDDGARADDTQTAPATSAYANGAVPGYPAPVAHSRTHGS